jgi:gas vesicle protein
MSRSSSSSDSPLLLGLLLGVLQGVLLGVLFAPKTGTQLNRDVNRFINTLPDQLSDEDPTRLGLLKRARIRLENGVTRVRKAWHADRLAQAKQREEQATTLAADVAHPN